MGFVQKDAFRTTIISYFGAGLGYLNKGFLFLIILSTEQIGLVNLILSIGLLFSRFSGLGVTAMIWKFLPYFKNKSNNHHGFLPFVFLINLFGILLFSTVFLLFISQIEVFYSKKSDYFVDYYFWVLPIGIGYAFFLTLEAYLRSFYVNVIAVFANDIVLRLSVTILLVALELELISFHYFVVLHSFIYVLPALILIAYLAKKGELNLRIVGIKISKRFRRIIFNYSSFIFINTIGTNLVASLDVLMISSMVGLRGTGVYTTVVFLISAIQIPYRSMIRISLPLVAEYWRKKEMHKLQELYTKVSSSGLFISFSFFIIIWLNIDLLFSFLKPEFQSGIWVFFFIMIGRLVDMYFGINGAIFAASKKYRYDMIFTLVLILVVYVLNLLFIPWWGIIGAAISTAIATIAYNIGRIIFVWSLIKMHPFAKSQLKVIALGIITILIGAWSEYFLSNVILSALLKTIIFLAIYVGPIVYFDLEPESSRYIKQTLEPAMRRISKWFKRP